MPFKPYPFLKSYVNHYDFFIKPRGLHKIFYTTESDGPDTGDNMSLLSMLALLLASMATISGLLIGRKRES